MPATPNLELLPVDDLRPEKNSRSPMSFFPVVVFVEAYHASRFDSAVRRTWIVRLWILGAMQGIQMGRGIDAIMPPVVWTTPLGAIVGAIVLPAIAAGVSSGLGTTTCPHCHKTTDGGARFCGNCGRSLDRGD